MKLRNGNIKYGAFIILYFFILFEVNLKRTFFYLSIAEICFLCMVLLVAVDFLKNKKIDLTFAARTGLLRKEYLSALALYSAFITYVVLITFMYGTNEFEFALLFRTLYVALLKVFMIPLFCFFVLFKEKATIERYVLSLLIAVGLLFLTSILLNMFPPLKEWWFGNLAQSATAGSAWRIAITGVVGDSTARITGFYFILGAYLVANDRMTIWNKGGYMVLLAVCALATLFFARTGVFAVALGVMLMLKNREMFNKFVLMAVLAAVVALGLAVAVPRVAYILEYMFEMFVNLFRSGALRSDSTDVLFSTYHLPPWNTLLFGNGTFTRTEAFVVGDSGIMRGLYYFGAVGMLLQYICVYGFYRVANKSFVETGDFCGSLVCKLTLMLFFIWEIKLVSAPSYIIFFTLLYWLNHMERFRELKFAFKTIEERGSLYGIEY